MRLLIVLSLLSSVAACTRGEVHPCNPKTILVRFSCSNDLSQADGLNLQVTRDDGATMAYTSMLGCPGTSSFEISVPKYVQGQRFLFAATPSKGGVLLGEATSLVDVRLEPKCTSIEMPLVLVDNLPMDASVTPDVSNDHGADTLPPCTPGSLGCTCLDGGCDSGLVCEGAPPLCGPRSDDCGTGASSSCAGNYACLGSMCRTECTGDEHCQPAFFCKHLKCLPKLALGVECQTSNQCGSGNCVDGVCCVSSSCGSCQQCNLTGDGACSAVAAGQPDPKKMCVDQGAASCGQTGLCGENGGCQVYACTCDGFVMPNSASSGLPNAASYDVSVAGAVTDRITKLTWEKGTSASTYTQAEAITYCSGKAGWRLPTLLELYSIVDSGRSLPAIDPGVFSSTPNLRFWTSTPVAGNSTKAWSVNFAAGDLEITSTSDKLPVRCVR